VRRFTICKLLAELRERHWFPPVFACFVGFVSVPPGRDIMWMWKLHCC